MIKDFLSVVLMIAIIAGCGYKGPLVIPPKRGANNLQPNASGTNTMSSVKINTSNTKINTSSGVSKMTASAAN